MDKIALEKKLKEGGVIGSADFSDFTAPADAPGVIEPASPESDTGVSEDDKAAFIHALTTNKRYERDFSLFGGAVKGVFKSKTMAEATGVATTLDRLRMDGELVTPMEYKRAARSAAFRFHVKQLNGVDYPEAVGPFGYVMSAATGKVSAPEWVAEAERMFGGLDDGLSDAVRDAVDEFERKYWIMVDKAANQNFWRPAESTTR
jgi:hypothetical protein